MQGRCSSCNRTYEISDEFVAMGGKAQCPHCLEDLRFDDARKAAGGSEPSADQTRIDPDRDKAATRVEPGEVNARCAICNRNYKIDASYLHMSGRAKCPHCEEDLLLDVPQPAPPPKQPAGDLWSDQTEQTAEVDEQGAPGEPAAGEPHAGEDLPAAADEQDPYAGTGGVSLPELDLLQEASPQAVAKEAGEIAGEERLSTEPDGVMPGPNAMDEDTSFPEEPDGWPEAPEGVDEVDRTLVDPEPFAQEPEEQEEQEEQEVAADEETRELDDQWSPGQDDDTMVVEEGESPFADLASNGDWATSAAAWAEGGFQADQMPSFIKSEPPLEEETNRTAEPAEQSSVEPVGQGQSVVVDGLPEMDREEVSDADIIMLDDAEVEQLGEPGPAEKKVEDASWARRATREIEEKSSPVEAAPALELPRFVSTALSRLSSPPVLAAVLGVAALAIISLLWSSLGSGEDVEGVEFPTRGIETRLVDAPRPRAYKARKSAVEHYGLGNRQAHLGNFEEAISEYQQASRLDPGYPHPHRAMGAIYAALGKAELSAASYGTYLRLEPKGPDADQVKKILEKYRSR